MKINSNSQKIILLSLGFFMLLMVMAVFHENGILNAYRFEQEQVKMKEENEGLRRQNDLLKEEIISLLETQALPLILSNLIKANF